MMGYGFMCGTSSCLCCTCVDMIEDCISSHGWNRLISASLPINSSNYLVEALDIAAPLSLYDRDQLEKAHLHTVSTATLIAKVLHGRSINGLIFLLERCCTGFGNQSASNSIP